MQNRYSKRKPQTFLIRGIWLLLAFALPIRVYANDVQHHVWEKIPLAITLPLNQDRLVRFPSGMVIVDSELGDSVHIVKLQEALYFRAIKPFHQKRLVVQLMPAGDVIILQLSASETMTDATPVEIVLPTSPSKSAEATTGNETQGRADAALNPLTLTRFAIQSLYSPDRLLVIPNGVRRVAMRTQKTVPLVYGAAVLARPLISWEGEGLYVTAVELKNALNKAIVLDPRQLKGDWESAAFYPSNQLNARDKATVTVFVTSRQPFAEALTLRQGFVR